MFRILSALAVLIAIPLTAAWAASSVPVRVQIVDAKGVPVRDAVVEIDAAGPENGRITFPWRMAMAQPRISISYTACDLRGRTSDARRERRTA